jgi:hypothetical protein
VKVILGEQKLQDEIRQIKNHKILKEFYKKGGRLKKLYTIDRMLLRV